MVSLSDLCLWGDTRRNYVPELVRRGQLVVRCLESFPAAGDVGGPRGSSDILLAQGSSAVGLGAFALPDLGIRTNHGLLLAFAHISGTGRQFTNTGYDVERQIR